MVCFHVSMVTAASLADLFGSPDRRLDVARGEFVFHRGDAAEAVYEVLRGRIRLERTPADGSVLVLGVLQAGDGLAEASVFGDRYHCDAVAEVKSRLAVYHRRRLLARLAADPALAQRWLGRMASEVRRLRALLEVRGVRPLSARVLAWLRLRDQGLGPDDDERPLRAMADEIGVSPEALYRVLAELESSGQIRRQDGRVERIP